MKYDFISSLEASNIKSYEVAVAMKYAAHIAKEFILHHIAVITAILHNERSELLHTCHRQVLHFTSHPLENWVKIGVLSTVFRAVFRYKITAKCRELTFCRK